MHAFSYLAIFLLYTLQFFLVLAYNCCSWQSSNNSKRIHVQKTRHNEAFIWLNNIFPINESYNGNCSRNGWWNLEGLSFTMRYTQTVGEVFFIIVTIVAYMYLVYFVRSKSREIANQRRGGIKIDKKLLMTIAYTYICLVIFTFPYFAERVAHFILQTVNPLMSMNLKFWGRILVYSNSYTNAMIIVYNSR